jgi:hypothetical protein
MVLSNLSASRHASRLEIDARTAVFGLSCHPHMAFRIHDSIVRGEIDNRMKGMVRGKIWVEGRAEPIILELKGNAHPDLAGCILTFNNLGQRFAHPQLDSLELIQRGAAGDMTASRKARVFDVPLEDAYRMSKQKQKTPEHLANSLYLEWFSETNGRVVIESTDYELTISAPAWQLTEKENERRASDAAEAMQDFLDKLTKRIEQHERPHKTEQEVWNEHDYERFLKQSDARTDKYGELLDKYGDSDEAEEKIAHEMGWDRELTDEEEAGREQWIEEMNRACEEAVNEPEPEPDPHREGIDWIRSADGGLRHPLQHVCFESAMKLWHEVKALGLEENPDRDLADLVSEFQIASAKLAGALSGIARGQGLHEGAFTVAYLKRALSHLHKAQGGLEAVAPKNLLPNELVTQTRSQLFEIREGILELMERFRG